MKDRVVQHPNRYKLTQISGDIYDLTPEPGIVTEPGTDLNKANLLKDDTAALYGLGADAVPDEVFNKLVTPIGDIKTTVRTDLGEDWLLCNGAVLDANAYPELAPHIADVQKDWIARKPGTSYNLNSASYGNGYWVAVGQNGILSYIDNIADGAWVTNNQGNKSLYDVAYGDGYWVAVGDDGTLYYKQGTPAGSWTQNNQGTTQLRGITYANGYWVAVKGYGELYYKQGAPNGAWTKVTVNNTSAHFFNVIYGNGYWVAVGQNGNLYYKQGTPAGSWTQNNQGSAHLYGVAYGDGYWVTITTNGPYYKQGTPNGAWTQNTITTGTIFYDVAYANGCWVAVGISGNLFYKQGAPDGAWAQNNHGTLHLNNIVHANGCWVVAGDTGWLYYTTKLLPSIAYDGAYVYIKAK